MFTTILMLYFQLNISFENIYNTWIKQSDLKNINFWKNQIPEKYHNYISDFKDEKIIPTSIIFYLKNNEKILNPLFIDTNTDAHIFYYDDCNQKNIKHIKSKYCNSEECTFLKDDISKIWGIPYYLFFNQEDYKTLSLDENLHFSKNDLIIKNSSINNNIQQIFTFAQESCNNDLKYK